MDVLSHERLFTNVKIITDERDHVADEMTTFAQLRLR